MILIVQCGRICCIQKYESWLGRQLAEDSIEYDLVDVNVATVNE